jgi:hypothetical protein
MNSTRRTRRRWLGPLVIGGSTAGAAGGVAALLWRNVSPRAPDGLPRDGAVVPDGPQVAGARATHAPTPAAPPSPANVPASPPSASAAGGPVSVTLNAAPPTVRIGQPYTITGAGWLRGAPVTLAVVKVEGNVAIFLRGTSDAAGEFSFAHALAEPGTWTHGAHWQPDPAVPPRTPVATIQVTCVG